MILPYPVDRCHTNVFFFFSSRRRHTRYWRDWSSDVCSSDLFVHADVSRHAEIRDMIGTAVERFGRLDILVNNAHWEKHGTVVELEEADWDRSFDVLLKALYLGCKYAIPEMRKVNGGAIVNIASVHAYS